MYTLGMRLINRWYLSKSRTLYGKLHVFYNDELYGDVSRDATYEEAEQAVDFLNRMEAKAEAFRAQFATEDEWMRYLDENCPD